MQTLPPIKENNRDEMNGVDKVARIFCVQTVRTVRDKKNG